ncbi:sialin-like isoform X2 [Diprion similis]|uniref:sialin-like isoform X2 n=1 Tax=Diprion similis TaxID=362088 RepID=UPI001EF97C73|nr:sialin-like isoform X2 [Diprion similis]
MKTYGKFYQRYFPQFIPVRFMICVMMFTACWTSYMARLQMPILVVPMTASKNGSSRSGYCDKEGSETSRQRRAIWYDPENIYDPWTYENEVQDDSSEAAPHRQNMNENNISEVLLRYELRWKRDLELLGQERVDNDEFSLFSKRVFKWDAQIQAQLLSSYGYGNAPGNFVGGIVAIKWGPKRSIFWTTLIAAILSLISPILAQIHWGVLCLSRVIIGFAGGITFPACHSMVAKWAPPDEKSRFVWSLLGGSFGTIITYPMVAAIADSINWQTAWYLPSLMMIVWVILWALIAYDSPEEHPGITDEEKEYIARSQVGIVRQEKPTLRQTPVKKIITSVPFISLVCCHFGNMFLLFFYQNSMTQYLTKSLGFKLTKGGALASLPWAGRMVFGFFFSWVGDLIKRRKYISITWLRKFATIFSHLIPGLFLIGVSYAGCNFVLANLFLVLSLGFNGCAVIANLSNNQDLSPNFAGFLYGIMNTLGCTSAFIGPPIVAAIIGDEDSIENWQIVFWVGAAVCIFSMIIFFIGGSGEVQPWNDVITPADAPATSVPTPTVKYPLLYYMAI